ncbi:unnamed protein product [Linum trigynum]|uniref:Uncharacterized protein n=1 Tax=Linum trigynum TaxID=586398 RepID=A0AAV2EAA4_9ROSI
MLLGSGIQSFVSEKLAGRDAMEGGRSMKGRPSFVCELLIGCGDHLFPSSRRRRCGGRSMKGRASWRICVGDWRSASASWRRCGGRSMKGRPSWRRCVGDLEECGGRASRGMQRRLYGVEEGVRWSLEETAGDRVFNAKNDIKGCV